MHNTIGDVALTNTNQLMNYYNYEFVQYPK